MLDGPVGHDVSATVACQCSRKSSRNAGVEKWCVLLSVWLVLTYGLTCSRIFQRCDGARPVCTQCIRGGRLDDCEYTDTQGRTRTQILEENVARLQARIQELENPEEASAPVLLHDPYAAQTARLRRGGPGQGQASQFMAGGPAGSNVPIIRPGSVPAVMSWWEFEDVPANVSDSLCVIFAVFFLLSIFFC